MNNGVTLTLVNVIFLGIRMHFKKLMNNGLKVINVLFLSAFCMSLYKKLI